MTRKTLASRIRLIGRAPVLALALGLGACASDADIRAAASAVSEAFRVEYESNLAENGTRTYSVRRDPALEAMRACFADLHMNVEHQDPVLGYFSVFAPAPLPLTSDEWRVAEHADLPRMRDIARQYVGILAWFIPFEPDGLEIVITTTILERAPRSSEISLTMRMREVAPPPTGRPRRTYAPPTAVRIGLDKIWAQFEKELKASASK